MKIAVASNKNDVNSLVDERFGRCTYFYIYDTETKQGEFFENELRENQQGVGTKVVEFLANKEVKKIFAVEVGQKAKDMLNKLQIDFQIIDKDNIVKNIIDMSN